MTVALTSMRDLLLPGLMEMTGDYKFAYYDNRAIFGTFETTMAAPHIWIPKLTLPQAVVVGAAAAIIKNPEITRRFWSGWR